MDCVAAARRRSIRSGADGPAMPNGPRRPARSRPGGTPELSSQTGRLAVETRSVATILDEWRTLERSLSEPMDADARIELERAIADLAAEHRAAVEAQQPEAQALGALPSMGSAEP